MKIPAFVLTSKCDLSILSGVTPSGSLYETPIYEIPCYVEFGIKWDSSSSQSLNEGQQHERFTKIFFNNTSQFPLEIANNSKITIEGDSHDYVVVEAQLFKQPFDSHWEVICR